MILQCPRTIGPLGQWRIIVGAAGFEPRTSDLEVWNVTKADQIRKKDRISQK